RLGRGVGESGGAGRDRRRHTGVRPTAARGLNTHPPRTCPLCRTPAARTPRTREGPPTQRPPAKPPPPYGSLGTVRRIHVIGIGAGDPDQLTLQAVKALRDTDVFFVLDKGEVKADLVQLRRDLLDAHVPAGSYRLAEARDPERDRRAGG